MFRGLFHGDFLPVLLIQFHIYSEDPFSNNKFVWCAPVRRRKMTKERIQNRALFTSEHISEYKEAFRLRDEILVKLTKMQICKVYMILHGF